MKSERSTILVQKEVKTLLIYKEKLAKFLSTASHQGELKETAGLEKIVVVDQGVTLSVLVDCSTHTIKKAAFSGVLLEEEQGFFEGLCQIIEKKPLLECSDHAIIQLEFELRDHTQPSPVKGIVLPNNTDPRFERLEKMVRSLLQQYRDKTKFNSIDNFFHPVPALGWSRLTHNERKSRIEEALHQFDKDQGLSVDTIKLVSVDDIFRITVKFASGQEKAFEQKMMLKLESYLKNSVEKTLEVYTEELKDFNKIRRL